MTAVGARYEWSRYRDSDRLLYIGWLKNSEPGETWGEWVPRVYYRQYGFAGIPGA